MPVESHAGMEPEPQPGLPVVVTSCAALFPTGDPSEIAQFFGVDISTIQNQLDKFELGGIISSTTWGWTRLYVFNPRYPFLKELKQLLEKALSFYPEDVREKLVMERLRPRRRGKPV